MRKLWLIFSQTATICLAALLVVSTLRPDLLSGMPQGTIITTVKQTAGDAAAPRPSSYNDAARKAMPAVVNIFTTQAMKAQQHPLRDDPLFRFFFGDQPDAQAPPSTNLGSGVIVSDSGYILTNSHVVEAADDIEIALADTRRVKAKVVGTDPESDLAVLKIDLPKLPAITFSQPDSVHVGDVVLAIGNPYGFGQSVSQGIISATGRYGLRLATYEDYIQTDAAINPGNSGGALIDADGKLIGINTAIYTQSGGSSGIGLAIPVDIAVRTMQDLVAYGHPMRGWLGIEVQRLPAALATANHLDSGNGVILTNVYKEGPAAAAGLQTGDILLAINGQAVGDGHAGLYLLASTRPGDAVTLQVVRNTKQLQLKMIVGTRPAANEAPTTDTP